MMRERIEILYNLLAKDGTFCVHIDDNELGYPIALADEIFGRNNRAYIVTFEQSSVSGPKAINPGLVTKGSFILIYAKKFVMPQRSRIPIAGVLYRVIAQGNGEERGEGKGHRNSHLLDQKTSDIRPEL